MEKFSDFTEENYRYLLSIAKQNYDFIFYVDIDKPEKKYYGAMI